jgi:uncharacterized phage protein (TIGR01671 family)
MQYTGLLDNQGVEIYEGDICQKEIGNIGVVKWDEEQCLFDFEHKHTMTLAKSQISKLKVIGNIYENPELLEAQ